MISTWIVHYTLLVVKTENTSAQTFVLVAARSTSVLWSTKWREQWAKRWVCISCMNMDSVWIFFFNIKACDITVFTVCWFKSQLYLRIMMCVVCGKTFQPSTPGARRLQSLARPGQVVSQCDTVSQLPSVSQGRSGPLCKAFSYSAVSRRWT